ncbi:GTP pyrophosphokinase family protein [uncultured Clostridium sp.]|uniref:GTP pyrophosphokinase n=1 Tax=uncultured Clostridium sp. TaxID=59620 RepID=UPI00261EC9B1|nr:relA/spoT family protein [uncultured Clostridium sp.]
MQLTVFDFTQESIDLLNILKADLNSASDILDDFFFSLLENNCDGFFNISTRVKSKMSLKEKIIRNNYYLSYNSAEELFSNLSDLIGVRIECRFIEDEENIFKYLKSSFTHTNSDGYSFSPKYPNILLDLREEQPLNQKNGFKLYRIDAYIKEGGHTFNFELQIKAMVNLFWSEIEHKVIYKNYNMVLGDKFYKNILNSIKSNLSMIDNQLLTIFNHMNEFNNSNQIIQKDKLEELLSKMIFDLYSTKVKEDLGISVDFRNACDIIVDYIFTKNKGVTAHDQYNTFIQTSVRLNEIFQNDICFRSSITFTRPVTFKSDFSSIVGKKLSTSMNKDFHWNLFFKILFDIEPCDQVGDFEIFMDYLETIFSNRDSYLNFYLKFNSDQVVLLKKEFLSTLCNAFLAVDSIEFIYRDKLLEIYEALDEHANFICDEVTSFEYYELYRDVYNKHLYLKLLSIFNASISVPSALEFTEQLKTLKSKIRITTKGLNYINSLDKEKAVISTKLLKYIYIR